MSPIARLTIRVFTLVWAGYTVLAQPGIPACWLERHACEIHIHLSEEQAKNPHTHGYLFDLASADGAPALPSLLIPLNLLLALLFGRLVLRELISPMPAHTLWEAYLDPPPPRFPISS
jgi:hypothetical protein